MILRHSSAAAIPFEDATFDKALAVNSVHIWPDPLAGLKELRRVLKPGGLLVVTVQPVWARADEETSWLSTDLTANLTRAGFQQVRLETRSLKPGAVSAIGVK